MGVPTLGCDCAVCTSADPHDRRLRPSIMLRWREPEEESEGNSEPESLEYDRQERVVVIDTGPDFREQALRNGVKRVDAVFYTHGHADHMLGLDDLRPLSFKVFREGGPIPLYASVHTIAILERVYEYTFSPNSNYPTRARVELRPLAERNTVFGVDFIRVPVWHGQDEICGFRFGKAAYLTDVSDIPEKSFALLEGLDCLVLSALRRKPHPTHATLEQAVRWAQRIGAGQTWFTHIAHDLAHEETNRMLPDGIRLAHDGLSFPVKLDQQIYIPANCDHVTP